MLIHEYRRTSAYGSSSAIPAGGESDSHDNDADDLFCASVGLVVFNFSMISLIFIRLVSPGLKQRRIKT